MLLFNPYLPDPRVRQEAISLSKAGFQVSIIAWNKNGNNNQIKEKGFKVYHLGQKLPPDFSKKPLFYQIIIKFWALLFFSLGAFSLTMRLKPNIIHAHDLDTLHIGLFSSKFLKIPLIYDSHELYALMLSKNISQSLVKKIDLWEKFLIRYVGLIITVSEFHIDHFKKKGAKNAIIVSNCKEVISTDYIDPDNSDLIISYIGALNESRFLLEGINVCSELEDVQFNIAGSGSLLNQIIELTDRVNNKNVKYVGRIPSDQVINEIRKSDVVFCMLDPKNMNNRVGPPNKLFEAMVAGRPVITSKGTYSGKLTIEENMGIAVSFTEEAFKQAIITLIDDPGKREEYGRNALKAALTKYNWGNEEKKLLQGYNNIITNPNLNPTD